MRVLLDENIDRRLRRLFNDEHEVVTVVEHGWSGVKNSELLSRAERKFDVLVAMDQNMQHQQNLSDYDLAIVVIKARSNRFEDAEPVMRQMNNALPKVEPGAVVEMAA